MPNKNQSLERLLYSRKQVAELLGGVNVATIVRLERAGRLRPVRLSGTAGRGKAFFKAEDVHRLVESATKNSVAAD